MTFMAAPFISTIGGGITLSYGPLFFVALGWFVKRVVARLDKQDANYIAQDKAMALVLAQFPEMRDRLTIAEGNINTLDKAQAVLQAHIDAAEVPR